MIYDAHAVGCIMTSSASLTPARLWCQRISWLTEEDEAAAEDEGERSQCEEEHGFF